MTTGTEREQNLAMGTRSVTIEYPSGSLKPGSIRGGHLIEHRRSGADIDHGPGPHAPRAVHYDKSPDEAAREREGGRR